MKDQSITTYPVREIIFRFEMSPTTEFAGKAPNIQPHFDQYLSSHHSTRKKPCFLAAPKLRAKYPPSGATDEPIRFDLINETGFQLQALNGRVVGAMSPGGDWSRFVVVSDYLLAAYQQACGDPEPRDFLVDVRSVLKLKGSRNYEALLKIVPSVYPPKGCFLPIADVAKRSKARVQPERLDVTFTVNVGRVEFIYDIQAPANDDHTLLWLDLRCRSPQEEYATKDVFSLAAVEPFLRQGLAVYEKLVSGLEVEAGVHAFEE
ncbi:MAG: hypothetical protein JW889_09490 [Verrucomicrobia bacterium]|nr:hypothetical protein [Verrucomicrobiota bacterium]